MELQSYEQFDRRDVFIFLLGLVSGCLFGAAFMVDNPATDYYYLNLTGITDLSASSPTLPAFNFTLYVENVGFLYENRFSHGQATVSYAGVAIGEGHVPGMCAGPWTWETAEVKALARGSEGAPLLSESQRKRLEAEMRQGSAEFDVEAKLFRDGQTKRGPVVLWCKLGQQELPQPSGCKAFTDLGRKNMERL